MAMEGGAAACFPGWRHRTALLPSPSPSLFMRGWGAVCRRWKQRGSGPSPPQPSTPAHTHTPSPHPPPHTPFDNRNIRNPNGFVSGIIKRVRLDGPDRPEGGGGKVDMLARAVRLRIEDAIDEVCV